MFDIIIIINIIIINIIIKLLSDCRCDQKYLEDK